MPRALGGFGQMVLAAFFFSVMSVLVKLAGERLPFTEIVLARAVVTFVLSWVLIRRARVPILGHRRGLLVLRGLLGTAGLACFFYALTRLPLADTTVIHFTNPVLTAVLAALFLGERGNRLLIFCLALCLAGVVLVARPTAIFGGALAAPIPLDSVAVAAAFGGALASAGAYVTVRALRTEHPLVIVFYFPLVATPIVLPFAIAQWVWPTPMEWVLLLGVGVVTQIAQVFLPRGLHLLPASKATAVGYLQIVFATFWGIVIFGQWPDALGAAGALLVFGGALLARRAQATSRAVPSGPEPSSPAE